MENNNVVEVKNMKERLYQMKDLIERFGVSRDTIKYYEQKSLINPIRNKSGYRQYTETDVQKIRKIQELKGMGFTLEECRVLFLADCEGEVSDIVEAVERKIEKEIGELSQKLQSLQLYKNHIEKG